MKRRMSFVVSFIITITCLATVWAQDDTDLNTQVKALYERLDQMAETKDLDAYMGMFSSDYQMVFAGPDAEGTREMLEKLMKRYDEFRGNHTLGAITRVGNMIKVVSTQKLEGKNGDNDFEEIVEQDEINYLIQEGDSLKFHRAAVADKDRLKNVQGRTYKEDKVGFSFSVPENWEILPSVHPNMLGTVYMMAPDTTSAAMLGYIELPGITAKMAAEGDESAGKKLAGDNYKFYKSGPIQIGEHEGFEIESEFTIKGDDRERRRRRVYFDAGGLLYVLCLDAMPAKQWDGVKDGFQSIVDSFKLESKDGAKRVREMEASGEVVDRIYSNSELGCQIAAPEGWSMKASPLGPAYLFNVNITPPDAGDSIVRFLAVDLSKAKPIIGEEITVEMIIEKEIKGLKKVTDNVEAGPIEDIQTSSHQGKSYTSEFSMQGVGTRKRKSAFYMIGDTLFCVLCDAQPPSEYDELESKFDEIISSLTLN